MLLLEAMPVVWCAVLAFALLYLLHCEKFTPTSLISATVGLVAAIAGVTPWLQVVLWCVSTLLVDVVRKCLRHRKQEKNSHGLVIYRSKDGLNACILYRGMCCTAAHGCRFAVMPLCGAVVQIFIYDNGCCIICPL